MARKWLRRDRLTIAGITLALAVVTGIGLRMWTLTSSLGALDSDEAVWGLMSLRVLDGELPTFFWAQEYGGTHEVLLTSLVVALVGPSALAIRLVPLALFAVAVWLVRSIGRATVGEPAATYAAALMCVFPAYLIWKSTRAHGFYGSGLVLGLLAVLILVKLRDRDSPRLYAALGLVLGLGLWATPQVGLLALPGIAWLVARRPAALRGAAFALPAAVLGALPWILWNVEHDWASFDRAVEEESGKYLGRLRGFGTALLPTALGLRSPFSLDWVVGAPLGWLALGAAVLCFGLLALRDRRSIAPFLVIAAAYPFLFALSPFAWFTEEPRYLVLLCPVVALLFGHLVARTRLAPLLVAACALLSVAGLVQMERAFAVTADGRKLPSDLQPLVDTLDREQVRHVLADYQLAYVLTFDTNERIVAAPIGQPRHEEQKRAVLADQRRAYATVAGSPLDAVWRNELRDRRRRVAGGFAVYLPGRDAASTRRGP